MDSWEFNKIAAAVLAALLIAFGSSTVVGLMHGEHGGGESHEKAGYALPVDVADASGGAATTEKSSGPDFNAILAALPSASAEAGEGVFKKCKTCHTPNEGGKNAVGPNLWNIVNRTLGAHDGFNYSKAMKEKGGKWDFESLAHFIYNPKKWLKGTKMAFAGVKDPGELTNVLAYLRTLSGSPAPLPAPAAGGGEKPAPTPASGEKPKAPDGTAAKQPAPPAAGGDQPATPAASEDKPKAN